MAIMPPRLRLLFTAFLFVPFLVSSGYSNPERDMGIYTELPAHLSEVDVIIAGGGTAGCVLASRLSDAHPELSILIIERGSDNEDVAAVDNPLFWVTNVMPGSPRMLTYHGADEPQIGNRGVDIFTGSVLGGGSSINCMAYSRAQSQAMDEWHIPGWGAKDLWPYMKKIETYHDKSGSPDIHGYDGPLQITAHSAWGPTRLQDEVMKAAAWQGYPEAVDLQDTDTINAFQRCHHYIDGHGKRQNAAHAYLHPRLQDGKHPNLHVLTQHHVLRALIEDGKAVGVEFVRNTDGSGTGSGINSTAKTHVRAKKMVAVTAGNFGSPQILERSGVGDPEVLAKAGIKTAVDLPGVGRNLQDHLGFFTSYLSGLPSNETYNGVFNGSVSLPDMVEHHNSKVGWTAYEVTSRLRPTDCEVHCMGPEFEAAWKEDFGHDPTKTAGVLATYGGYYSVNVPQHVPNELFSVAGFVTHPHSRGSIHVTGPSFSDTPRLVTGYLNDEGGFDTQLMVWMYKKQREMVRRMPTYRGEYCPDNPSFPEGSDAACVPVDGPFPKDAPNIKYTAEDNKAIEEWCRKVVASHSHSVGTCKMGSRHDGGVLDEHLNVHGVQGLKVADLSIAPLTVQSNSANLAFTIGEKAGDIISREFCKETS